MTRPINRARCLSIEEPLKTNPFGFVFNGSSIIGICEDIEQVRLRKAKF
jgi:hypothetical protein